MPLDPLELLDLSKEIAKAGGECRLRTATNRADYSMFLVAREKVGVTDNADVHSRTIAEVRRLPGGYGLATQLHALRVLRKAVYHLVPSHPRYANWQDNREDELSYVEVLEPGRQSL